MAACFKHTATHDLIIRKGRNTVSYFGTLIEYQGVCNAKVATELVGDLLKMLVGLHWDDEMQVPFMTKALCQR